MSAGPDYVVRPMTVRDVAAVEQVTDEAFLAQDLATHRADRDTPQRRTAEQAELWRTRVTHLVEHDPRGCWVAEDAHGVLGVAVSMRRELTWLLASLAVRPGVQGRGVGRQVLDAALSYGTASLRGMLAASDDPAALRLYRAAGFALHPTMQLVGRVPRAVLPVVERVREGSAADLDLLDSVDRRVRDAAHGVDHRLLAGLYPLVVLDRSTGSGYAYVARGGGPFLLAATNRRTATDLLWETLAATDPGRTVTVARVSAANEWAVDVGLACRLALGSQGFLALRGMRPPAPYLPSGQFL